MNGFALLILFAALSVVLFLKVDVFQLAVAQPSIENSTILTSPNNPTVTTGEMFNGTNTESYNSNESKNNLPSPMWCNGGLNTDIEIKLGLELTDQWIQ